MEFAFTSEIAESLYAALSAHFPVFSEYLATESAFTGDDGRHSYSGIWADFSHWVRSDVADCSGPGIEWLGSYASACFGSKDSEISSAVATCFLENVAGEAVGTKLAPHLSSAARVYMNKWCAAS